MVSTVVVSTVLIFGDGDDLLLKRWHFIVTGVFGALQTGDGGSGGICGFD